MTSWRVVVNCSSLILPRKVLGMHGSVKSFATQQYRFVWLSRRCAHLDMPHWHPPPMDDGICNVNTETEALSRTRALPPRSYHRVQWNGDPRGAHSSLLGVTVYQSLASPDITPHSTFAPRRCFAMHTSVAGATNIRYPSLPTMTMLLRLHFSRNIG